MRFSRYILLNAAVAFAAFLLLAAVFLSTLGGAAFGWLLAFGLLLLLGFGLSVVWASRAVAEYDGAPMPGLPGVLGFDIVPDDEEEETSDWAQDDSRSGSPVRPEGPAPPSELAPLGAPPITPSSPEGSMPRRGCPRCGTITEGGDSRYCRKCGSPL